MLTITFWKTWHVAGFGAILGDEVSDPIGLVVFCPRISRKWDSKGFFHGRSLLSIGILYGAVRVSAVMKYKGWTTV